MWCGSQICCFNPVAPVFCRSPQPLSAAAVAELYVSDYVNLIICDYFYMNSDALGGMRSYGTSKGYVLYGATGWEQKVRERFNVSTHCTSGCIPAEH